MMKLDPRAVSAIIHAKTTNDASGNPRRCFVLLNGAGQVLAVTDEGYSGDGAWWQLIQDRADGRHARDGVEPSPFAVTVTPAEYRRLIRWDVTA